MVAGARTPLFEGLESDEVAEIYGQMRARHFEPGDVLCEEGEPGDSLFIVQSGMLQVLVGVGVTGRARLQPTRESVARLRRGDVVGELSVITGEARSATVIAVAPTQALEMERDQFNALLTRHPRVWANLARLLARRLSRADARLAETDGWRRGQAVALVTGQRGAAFTPRILEATRAATRRRVIGLNLVSRWATSWIQLEASVEGILASLDDLLLAYDTLVVIANDQHADLMLLLEHMDRVVALMDETEARRAAPMLAELADRLDLALLADGPPGSRAASLPAEAIAGMRVVRALNADDPARDVAWLGRHLSRTKLGLALGAGGARGFAHVGVLSVLEEAGYRVDYVAGSSMGALVGCWLAMGLSSAEIEATMRRAFSREHAAAMFEVSFSGLSAGLDALTRMCRETTGERTFADLMLPFAVTCVDLNTREPVTIVEGPLWEALVAATALPGVFPPFVRDGRRLVDGLALMPVPTQPVRELGADITIAVNILGPAALPTWPDADPAVAPPTRTGSRLLDTLLEVMDLAHADSSARHAARADLILQPQFGPSHWRDFHLAGQFVEAGRAEAEAKLGALRRLARPEPAGAG